VHLTPGTRLGPFEIVAPLGAGGMGEVYRARDTRLGRDVAVKALPTAFAQDPDRLARFEREAKLLASLSHPNIAGIHGLEEVDGVPYLVLEFVEGETLADRLARGPLPIDDAIDICRQIAAGVEAAHESGVVHRDLKPGNVMITPAGAVKVLDFGLAKGGGGSGSSVLASASPTMTYAATEVGVVLGTAAYMSPEQARGRAVDRRTDVWSFGCVLYECLASRQAYEGETVSDLIARILEREPDWAALPAKAPPRVVELIRRCLTKDATQRLRDMGEARIALGAAAGESGPGARGARAPRAWRAPALAAAFAMLATAAALLTLRPAAAPGPVRRFRIPVEHAPNKIFVLLAFARDGRQLAYEANGRIWIRRLDQLEPIEVPGSQGGSSPFWSWDQKTLAFDAGKKLWTYTPGGDPPKAIGDIPESGQIIGGAWGPDQRIVFSVWRAGLYEIPAGGGEARSWLTPDSTTVDFHTPSFLPDGRTLLVYVHRRTPDSAIAVVSGSPARLTSVLVEPNAISVSYATSGHLLFERTENESYSTVWAVPFSAAGRKVSGPAFKVLGGAAFASASARGDLIAEEQPPPPNGQLIWKRRDTGAEVAVGDSLPGLASPALSPDGGRLAYEAIGGSNTDVWVLDLARGTRTRLTSQPMWEGNPTWSADGSHIFYGAQGGVGNDWILTIASDGSGVADTISRGFQASASPDGRSIVFTMDRHGNADLWTARLDGSKARAPFLQTENDEGGASISPDGLWITYMSNESGATEIEIRRFPQADMRAQVSVGGGRWPRWSRRGDAILYVNKNQLMEVSVGAGPRRSLGLPRALFPAQAPDPSMKSTSFGGLAPFDVHPDGVRLIVARQIEPPDTRQLLLIENWLEEFHKR